MKYIRTKDGVYEVDRNSKGTEDFLWVKTNKANIVQCVWLNCILNQSENLDELCDEIVMTHYFPETNYTKCEVLNEDEILMIKAVRLKKQLNKDKDLKNEFNIYGAIWTDKGLIYVAKMNDKGELELI